MSGTTLDAPGARHAARPECRPDPDRAAPHRRDDAAAVPDAVRLQRLRPAGRRRSRLLASRPGQLLGPQRHHPHGGLRLGRRPADAARQGAVRRRHPEPRFRRGGAARPRRLGRAHGADGRRLLRGPAADAARRRRPRPALGAGQPAAPRHRVLVRHHHHGPSASADGRHVLSHVADLGVVARSSASCLPCRASR